MSSAARAAGRTCRATLLPLLASMVVGGCGNGAGEAGIPPPWLGPGAPTVSGDDPVQRPFDRMQPHAGVVLPNMRLRVVYIGAEDVDGVPSRDAFISWLLASDDYWSLLGQYGVGFGALAGSVRVPTAAFFPADALASGSVTINALAGLISTFVTADAFAGADSYIFFLPATIGITPTDGARRASCRSFGGYHWYLPSETGETLPYSIIPPCPSFPADLPVSHELAEMATDPILRGWYSDVDASNAGDEIGDLCNTPVTQPIHFWSPSRLWSNADGACAPP